MLLDIAGNRPWSECRRILTANGTLVLVGGPKTNRLVGPLGKAFRDRLASVFTSRKAVFFIAKPVKEDLAALADLLEAGSVTPVIDRQYELSELGDALRYLSEWHARGKVVITV